MSSVILDKLLSLAEYVPTQLTPEGVDDTDLALMEEAQCDP